MIGLSEKTSRGRRRLGAALPFLAALLLVACDRGDKEGEGERREGERPGSASPANPPAAGDEAPEPPGAERGMPPSQGSPGAGSPGAPGGQPGMRANPGQPPSGEPQPEGAEVPDEQLDQFAEALGEVREVRDEYEPKISQAESAEEAQTLQKEAMQKIESRVSETGMSVAEYERIATQVRARPELQAKVEARMKEMEN